MSDLKSSPDFLIIGSMKCGTTTLHSDIANLNGVSLPSEKEPNILHRYHDIKTIQRKYQSYFAGCPHGMISGEASTVYTMLPESEGVASKAKMLCGDNLKLIMIVRDPIQRIYSHLRHNIGTGAIKAKDVNREVIEDKSYVNYSNYPMQLAPWIDAFGKENILCLGFQDLIRGRTEVLERVARHIGVAFEFVSEDPDLTTVQNKSSEFFRTTKLASTIVNNPFYRNLVRPYVSDVVRTKARKILLPKAEIPKFQLTAAVEEQLRAELGNVELDMERMFGNGIFTQQGLSSVTAVSSGRQRV